MTIVAKVPFLLLQQSGIETRKRYFRFDLNALADFEQEVGMGFTQLMSSKAIFAAVRALCWAGLKHEDRSLTIQRMGTLLQDYFTQGGTLDEVLRSAIDAAVAQGALGRASEESVDGEDEGGEGNAPTPGTTETPGTSGSA